jgi:predicted esterase
MIGLIEADNTYDTVYGIGYFGLNKLTGVSYDEKHNGAWWRAWWVKNQQRFPADVQALEVPRFEPVRKSPRANADGAEPADLADILAEQRLADADTNKLYFLIGRTNDAAGARDGHRLLLVLPGGDGGRDFQPFVQRICKNALPEGYLVAQLIAPKWDETQFAQLVWPTETSRYPAMKFSTEEFVRAVVADVEKRHRLDTNHIFSLAWSSGGPAAYAASLDPATRITGSYVAMSVFKPNELPDLANAKGQAYYLLHSPEDFIPVRMAEQARDALRQHGATVQLQTYAGGHGWHGDVFGLIREGVGWLEQHAGSGRDQPHTLSNPKP